MLPGKKFTIADVRDILIRNRWIILLPFAAGVAVAPVIAERIPELYRSETLIMVIPQRVPNDFVKPTVTGSVEDRLTSINDVILSRSRLERIVTEFDLYPELRAKAPMEDVVGRMRGDINPAIDGRGRQSFRLSYVSDDPLTAQAVTKRLASLYIEEDLRDRENLAEGTSRFLESQLEDAKARLIEYEKKLEEYRRQHSGELPSQVNANLQAMQAAQMQLQANSEAINRARDRRLQIDRQIADLELIAQTEARQGEPNAPPPLAQQVAAGEAQLEQMKRRYTADHPDVRALARTIKDLRAQLEEELRNPPPPEEDLATPAELARQKRLKELQEDRGLVDTQIAAREVEELRLREAVEAYQSNVDVVPTRESELVELTRDYGTLQKTYADLLFKREESQIAANLERRQIGAQFRVLDEASLPQQPFNMMNRLAMTASGAIAGLVLGLVLTAARTYIDSSFRREDDVMRALSLPVLALVPTITSQRERRVARLWNAAVNVFGTAALLASFAVLIAWKLQE